MRSYGTFWPMVFGGKGRRSLFYVHQNLHPQHLRTHSLIFTPKLNMVTLSENSTSECSSTTIESRDHFGSNIVSSTNSNDREFSSPANPAAGGSAPASGTPAAPIAAPAAPGQNPPGLWDLTNPELGYEIASSGKLMIWNSKMYLLSKISDFRNVIR